MRNFANYDVDIHGKSSGVLKTICKKCLPTRKNKRDRSLRVNVDTGHCHCYHCGADFYVPDDVEERKNAERAVARKRRAAAIPQHFQRPMFDVSKTTLSEDTERWLVETRCIPQSVIAALRITEQEEFMPQSGKKERCICFNYFEGEQLINTKFRALPKLFKMVQGAELIPYNIDSILGQTSCTLPPELFPVHRAVRRGRSHLRQLPRQGLPRLQGHGLDRSAWRRHGQPEGAGHVRHRQQKIPWLCVRRRP